MTDKVAEATPLVTLSLHVVLVVVQVCAAGIVPDVGGSWSNPHTNSLAVSVPDCLIVNDTVEPTGWSVVWVEPDEVSDGASGPCG